MLLFFLPNVRTPSVRCGVWKGTDICRADSRLDVIVQGGSDNCCLWESHGFPRSRHSPASNAMQQSPSRILICRNRSADSFLDSFIPHGHLSFFDRKAPLFYTQEAHIHNVCLPPESCVLGRSFRVHRLTSLESICEPCVPSVLFGPLLRFRRHGITLVLSPVTNCVGYVGFAPVLLNAPRTMFVPYMFATGTCHADPAHSLHQQICTSRISAMRVSSSFSAHQF